MSKYFQTVRQPVNVTVGDRTVTFWVRELGYLEFQEITQTTGRDLPTKEERGLAIVNELCVASIQDKDGNPAFTAKEWRQEPRAVVSVLIPEVTRVNGIKSDEIKQELTEEEIEGNALPSKRSGSNSPTLSAAPSVNLKIA